MAEGNHAIEMGELTRARHREGRMRRFCVAFVCLATGCSLVAFWNEVAAGVGIVAGTVGFILGDRWPE